MATQVRGHVNGDFTAVEGFLDGHLVAAIALGKDKAFGRRNGAHRLAGINADNFIAGFR